MGQPNSFSACSDVYGRSACRASNTRSNAVLSCASLWLDSSVSILHSFKTNGAAQFFQCLFEFGAAFDSQGIAGFYPHNGRAVNQCLQGDVAIAWVCVQQTQN